MTAYAICLKFLYFFSPKNWRFEKCLLMFWFSLTLVDRNLVNVCFLFSLYIMWLWVDKCEYGYGWRMVCGFCVAIFLHLNIYIVEPMANYNNMCNNWIPCIFVIAKRAILNQTVSQGTFFYCCFEKFSYFKLFFTPFFSLSFFNSFSYFCLFYNFRPIFVVPLGSFCVSLIKWCERACDDDATTTTIAAGYAAERTKR